MAKSKVPSGIVFISFILFLGLLGLFIKFFVNFEIYDLITLFVIVFALVGFKKRNPTIYKLTILIVSVYVLYLLYILLVNMLEFENIWYIIEDSLAVIFYFIIAYYLILRREFFINPKYKFDIKDKSYKKQELFFKIVFVTVFLLYVIVSVINGY